MIPATVYTSFGKSAAAQHSSSTAAAAAAAAAAAGSADTQGGSGNNIGRNSWQERWQEGNAVAKTGKSGSNSRE